MLTLTTFAVLALSGPLNAPLDAPGRKTPETLTLSIAGLDFGRPDHVALFVEMAVVNSRAFCRDHIETVTPDSLGDPRLCERAISDRIVRALPTPTWRKFVQAGGVASVNRQHR